MKCVLSFGILKMVLIMKFFVKICVVIGFMYVIIGKSVFWMVCCIVMVGWDSFFVFVV